MPTYARYWQNPEKWRKESRERIHHLISLGLTRTEQLSPAAQKVRLEYSRKWRRNHLKANAKASRKYRAKITKAFGSCSDFEKWQYRILKQYVNHSNTTNFRN